MKIAIVVAGLIVVVAAVLVAVQPGFLKPASMALVKKSDILGFSPGMTFDETNKLVTQRRYRCRQIRDSYVLECAVDGAKVTIFADDVDPGNPDPKHPIWRVIAELNNPGPQDAAVKSISDQELSYDGAALKLVDEAEEIRRGKQEAKR